MVEIIVKIIKLKKNGDFVYKVTKRIPMYHSSETKFFETKEEAEKQLHYWLN